MSRGTELKLSTTTRASGLTVALAGTLALAACGASNETPPQQRFGAGSSSAPSSAAP